ncbi:unnamed protein product [Cyclocybe aegerita]|uniref:Uncharacterized protein n=1 Tax=Cyclocybe aegerita TaxID=1973307 RepID=A0A8S0VYK7_CYCAE|nr:unnamed protein product [Cyclocybe aegerita]
MIIRGTLPSSPPLLLQADYTEVWALWHRSVKVAFILFSAFACEVIVMVYFAVRINLDLEYNDTCLIERTPKTAIGVVLPPILMQCLILALTLYKRYHNRDSLYPPPLVELVSRDGSAIFVAVSATFAISLSYSAHVHVLTHSVWSILATLLTIGGSRVVMNMQRLKVPFNARTETSDIQLTSYVATGTALVVTGISPSYFDPPGDLDGMEPEFPS